MIKYLHSKISFTKLYIDLHNNTSQTLLKDNWLLNYQLFWLSG